MAKLIVTYGDNKHEFELAPRSTLGRHPDNSIQILDRIVSKEHAVIELRGSAYVLVDSGSMNGTYVNGARVGEHVLRNGDDIVFGSTHVTFIDAPQVEASVGGVSVGSTGAESLIRSKIAADAEPSFRPEKAIADVTDLRRDYEKLRVSYELQRDIGLELDLDKLLMKILDKSFEMLPADRGVVLLFDEKGDLKPVAIKTRRESGSSEKIVLSSTIVNQVVREKAAVLTSDAAIDSRFKAAHSIMMQGIRSTMAVPLLFKRDLLGMMLLDTQVATNAFGEKDLQLTTNIANQAALLVNNSRLVKRIEEDALTRERFQRLLSPAIAELVVSGKLEVKKGGELRRATVLFADIRGFTAMSEIRTAQEVVALLNEYFEMMVEIIFKHEGTVDKFIGDEIMTLFGAPVAHADDAVRAVRCAMEMQQALDEFNGTRLAEGQEPMHIGIGVNTGDVVVGYIGSSKTMGYTAMGDGVNTASRLCSVAKAGEIILGELTYQASREFIEVEPLPPTRVKNKREPLTIYKVLGRKGAPTGPSFGAVGSTTLVGG